MGSHRRRRDKNSIKEKLTSKPVIYACVGLLGTLVLVAGTSVISYHKGYENGSESVREDVKLKSSKASSSSAKAAKNQKESSSSEVKEEAPKKETIPESSDVEENLGIYIPDGEINFGGVVWSKYKSDDKFDINYGSDTYGYSYTVSKDSEIYDVYSRISNNSESSPISLWQLVDENGNVLSDFIPYW